MEAAARVFATTEGSAAVVGGGTKTAARREPLHALAESVRERSGDDWPPLVYRERVRKQRTRSFQLPAPARSSRVEVQHTLLGVELKIGRRRVSCPDLATARYLAFFARAGCTAVAVPYDITKISRLADDLERGWQRALLSADDLAEGRGPTARARLRGMVAALVRREIEEAGAGAAVPAFKQDTKQRQKRA